MLEVVISGTIGGEYEFPNEHFSYFCYEGWGNVWSMISEVHARYLPAEKIVDEPGLLNEIDVLQAEIGQRKLFETAFKKFDVFTIGTESGAGFEFDKIDSGEGKLSFLEYLNRFDLILSTTYAGRDYLRLFVETPVLDIPLPIDCDKFAPRALEKFDRFTVCVGEIIESCYDDRPLQLEAVAIANSVGVKAVASIAPHARNFDESHLQKLGLDVTLYPHQSLFEMSHGYLARSHAFMMLGQRCTLGRPIYVSWAIGVPCIATRYQVQPQICSELTFGVEEISRIREALIRLKTDTDFYRKCVFKGRERVKALMSNESIALRIVNEIIPLYLKKKECNDGT